MNHHSKAGKAENLISNGDSESNSTRDEKYEASVFPAADSQFKQHSEEQENAQGSSDVTLEDMYNNNYEFEDDEDDDSDWEPSSQDQDVFEITKWFCVNCTMDNFGKGVHCEFCGEHRQSGIVKYGFLAPPLSEEGLTVNEADTTVRLKDLRLKGIVADNQTAIGFDERMLLHEEIYISIINYETCKYSRSDPGDEVEMKSRPHAERPDRLQAIAASLAATGIFPGRCNPILAREITREELQMVHSLKNIDAVELTSQLYSSYFTPDTYANQYSACAARLAAGLCFDLATSIYSGSAKNGFALVRPPGHHACVKQAMGFCLHNNAAIAASAAQRAGAKKVLIIDWDVHHGNGTQEIFETNKSVLYVSLHRHEGGKFYPGTGAADEVGTTGAEGYCVNIPWSCGGVGDNDYIFAFQQVVMPIASEFDPDFTIISAGFDAARGDPLGCCDVTPTGYAQMTQMCSALSGGKLLVILEGGYNLRSISASATSVVKVLLGDVPEHDLDQVIPTKAGLRTVLEVLQIQMKYWPPLEPKYLKLQSEWGCSALQDRRTSKSLITVESEEIQYVSSVRIEFLRLETSDIEPFGSSVHRTVVEEKEKMLDGSDLVEMGTQEVAISSLVQECIS